MDIPIQTPHNLDSKSFQEAKISSTSKKPKSPWITVLPAVLIIGTVALVYNFFYRGGFNDATWSESLAATSGVLIGLSFVLSSVSYYFDFADKQLRLRKQLGLYGFWIALAYCFSLQYRFPDRYFYGLFENITDLEVMLGLGAMFIFGYMALISNKFGVKVLGPKWWRRSFRFGYFAYFLLIIRAFVVEGDIWLDWLNYGGLPPPRMLLTKYATLVIMVRLMLEVSLRRDKRQKEKL